MSMRSNLAQSNPEPAARKIDRSDATTFYGGLFSKHRAGSSVYGRNPMIDDAPPPPAQRRHERRRRDAAKKGVHIGRYSLAARPHISATEKGILIFVAVFVAAIFIGVIAFEAYSVSIQHGINKKKSETAAIQKEIDELYVAIEKGSNISSLEKNAKKKLKMVYPDSDQVKYAKDVKVKSEVDARADIRGANYGT